MSSVSVLLQEEKSDDDDGDGDGTSSSGPDETTIQDQMEQEQGVVDDITDS